MLRRGWVIYQFDCIILALEWTKPQTVVDASLSANDIHQLGIHYVLLLCNYTDSFFETSRPRTRNPSRLVSWCYYQRMVRIS